MTTTTTTTTTTIDAMTPLQYRAARRLASHHGHGWAVYWPTEKPGQAANAAAASAYAAAEEEACDPWGAGLPPATSHVTGGGRTAWTVHADGSVDFKVGCRTRWGGGVPPEVLAAAMTFTVHYDGSVVDLVVDAAPLADYDDRYLSSRAAGLVEDAAGLPAGAGPEKMFADALAAERCRARRRAMVARMPPRANEGRGTRALRMQ